jgi:hypothetical protein
VWVSYSNNHPPRPLGRSPQTGQFGNRPHIGPSEMTADSIPHVDARALAELQRLARSRPRSGRGQTAKLGAIRTLERLGREGKSTLPMPADWHPMAGSAWEELDACDSLDMRDRWWRHLHP